MPRNSICEPEQPAADSAVVPALARRRHSKEPGLETKDSSALRHGFWALSDQGVVSLGTFLSNVILARSLPPREYGVYAVILGVLYFLHVMHGSVVVYPLSVEAAACTPDRVKKYATLGLLVTAAISLGLGLVLATVAWALEGPWLAGWGVGVLILWQTQETLRRSLTSVLRFERAIWGDAVSFLGQAFLLLCLAWGRQMTLRNAFAVMALTSGAAALLQSAQVGLVPISRAELRDFLAVVWRLGHWMLPSNLLGVISTHAFSWLLASFHGVQAAAGLQAVVNVAGVSHPILFSLGNLIVPAAARAYSRSGIGGARKCSLKHGAQGLLLVSPYFAAVLLWPGATLRLFYGSESPYVGLQSALRYVVLSYLALFVAQVAIAFLSSLQNTKAAFNTQLSAGLTLLLFGVPFTACSGVPGACLGLLSVNVSRLATGVYYSFRTEGEAPGRGAW